MNLTRTLSILSGAIIYIAVTLLLPTIKPLYAVLIGIGLYLPLYYLLPPTRLPWLRNALALTATILATLLLRLILP